MGFGGFGERELNVKKREKALLGVLGFVALATGLYFVRWDIRWIVLSYVPIILFLGHVVLFLAAFSKPALWKWVQAYLVAPVLIYAGFGFWIASVSSRDRSGWGGVSLPQVIITLPVLPFQLPGIAEDSIEQRKGGERRAAIASGALAVGEVLKGKEELTTFEQAGIFRYLSSGGDLSAEVLHRLILDHKWANHSPEIEVIRLALSHPNTDVETLIGYSGGACAPRVFASAGGGYYEPSCLGQSGRARFKPWCGLAD